MRVALINSNRIRPPIAPIGLDYLAEALHAAGHSVDLLDLCWADDWRTAVDSFFTGSDFRLVGLTLRNTDDCMFAGRNSFIDGFADLVAAVRQRTQGLLVVGGVGFSVMPEKVLDACGADIGIWGEGDSAFPELAGRIEAGREGRDLPHLIHQCDDGWHRNPPAAPPLDSLPRMTRSWVDNPRYFHEGGQAGFETKRGCPCPCIYCAEPIAKGSRQRLRPPSAVVDELEALLAQGIDHLHTCDSEFNMPWRHAADVCREIIRRDLGDRLRWYAYCAPAPFPPELAQLMRTAGCVGINFGADSGDPDMLQRLRRNFTPDDIASAMDACRHEEIAVMFDLLLGAPGETESSLRRTVELMQRIRPERVGVSLGVRVYPGTPLATQVQQEEFRPGLIGQEEPHDLLYFIDPAVAPFASDLLEELIGDDQRFFFDPIGPEKGYNYNDNQVLVDAIRSGHRGAYWDILRRLAEDSPA